MLTPPTDGRQDCEGMNMRRMIRLPACVLATALLPMSAMANRADYGFVRIEAGNIDAELEFDGQSASDDDSSYSTRGGYYFSPNWAGEGFYSRHGEREYFAGPESGTSLAELGLGGGSGGTKERGERTGRVEGRQ